MAKQCFFHACESITPAELREQCLKIIMFTRFNLLKKIHLKQLEVITFKKGSFLAKSYASILALHKILKKKEKVKAHKHSTRKKNFHV